MAKYINVVRWFRSADQDSEVLLSDVPTLTSHDLGHDNTEDMDQEKEIETTESSRLTTDNKISSESLIFIFLLAS